MRGRSQSNIFDCHRQAEQSRLGRPKKKQSRLFGELAVEADGRRMSLPWLYANKVRTVLGPQTELREAVPFQPDRGGPGGGVGQPAAVDPVEYYGVLTKEILRKGQNIARNGARMALRIQKAAPKPPGGVVPAYLTELSPGPVRATAPGLAYQLGGLITSWNGKGQALLAEKWGTYPPVLALTVAFVAIALAVLAAFGHEAKGAEMSIH